MQKAEKRLSVVLKKLKQSTVANEKITGLKVIKDICCTHETKWYKNCVLAYVGVSVAVSIFIFAIFYRTSECYLEMPSSASSIFRKPEDCGFCENVRQIDKIKNISAGDFANNYISTGKPVVITDGARGWTALETFSFDFFKDLYTSSDHEEPTQSNCQFFPYKTEFKSLEEALNMNTARARLSEGERSWYIGWSNCNDAAGKILRKHYDRPYFLPETSENMALNWIFMGGPGYGAHMHVDNVLYPSWQAQISGKKRWRLAPPPECFYKCQEVEVVVKPAEIIVVDTNRWYHQTYILPGDISITIGSEFD